MASHQKRVENPSYTDGNGLLTLIPMDFPNLYDSLMRYSRQKKKKKRNTRQKKAIVSDDLGVKRDHKKSVKL